MSTEEEDKREVALDESHFRKGLCVMGKTFNNARHAYL
jgi:hypothetical protein